MRLNLHGLSGQVVRAGIAVKIFDFFANRFGATLIFPWVQCRVSLRPRVSFRLRGCLAVSFFTNSNAPGRRQRRAHDLSARLDITSTATRSQIETRIDRNLFLSR